MMRAKRHRKVPQKKSSMLGSCSLSDLMAFDLSEGSSDLRCSKFGAKLSSCMSRRREEQGNTCMCIAKALKLEFLESPRRALTRSRPLHVTESNVWCLRHHYRLKPNFET